jgi:hypothetical protein
MTTTTLSQEEVVEFLKTDPEFSNRRRSWYAEQLHAEQMATTTTTTTTTVPAPQPRMAADAPPATTTTVPPTTTTTVASAWEPMRDINGIHITDNTLRWLDLIQRHFQQRHWNLALLVIECESNGNPNVVNSSSQASGLMQHLPKYWHSRSTKALGYVGDIFDPHDNIHVGAWLVYDGGGWSHYSCANRWRDAW